MLADPDEQHWTLHEQGTSFCVRTLWWNDEVRHAAYQALRARIFAQQLRWQVMVTPEGRERDRYDQRDDPTIQVHTVSLVTGDEECLLAGVRTFTLCSWDASMVMQEFRAAGMFSDDVLARVRQAYPVETLLEVTRLCMLRHAPALPLIPLHLRVAQDLTYAAVYRIAETTRRTLVLAVVSTGYRCLLQRMGFVVHVLHACQPQHKTGYILTIIDLFASIQHMRATDKQAQVARLLALCRQDWQAV